MSTMTSPDGIFELSQRFYFEAAHTLRREIEREGSLRIHGHTYEAEISLLGTPDPTTGMLADLGIVRREIARVRDLLDHQFLDDVPGLGQATLENLCAFIRSGLQAALPNLSSVTVARRASGDRCVLRLEPKGAKSSSTLGAVETIGMD
jgi:6-pyruvoyltetrahydropterin/6-carboxytetrahydropterin synthase